MTDFRFHGEIIMNQHIDHIVHTIIQPDWLEPECSNTHNIDSNLEFIGIHDDDPDYRAIVDRAVELYPSTSTFTFRRRITIWEDVKISEYDFDAAFESAHDTCGDRAKGIVNMLRECHDSDQGELVRINVNILDEGIEY